MLKFLLVIIVVLISLIVFVPWYFLGIGSKPKDLGISFTIQDSAAARDKVGTQIIPITAEINKSDFTLEGKRDIEFSMDSKELSAHSNNRSWKNYPVKNLQIKISNDGTIESSATLIVSKGMPYAMAMGYSEVQIKDAMKKYNIPPFEVPIYIKGRGQVINDDVKVYAQTITLGNILVPQALVETASSEVKKLLNDVIKKHSQSFHADSLTFIDGKMNFRGSVAEKEYVVSN